MDAVVGRSRCHLDANEDASVPDWDTGTVVHWATEESKPAKGADVPNLLRMAASGSVLAD
jgi:hypothetical protein